VHLHSLFLDGVYFERRGKLKFSRVPDPSDDEIATLVKRIRDRVFRYLTKKGFCIDDFSEDPYALEQPVMAGLAGASIQGQIAVGERAGQRVRRIGSEGIGDVYRIGNRCAVCKGFSLHANVKIEGRDRDKLEKLCRYTARPPVALERLSQAPDGKILYSLKTQYSDGTTHVLFEPMELVEKVVALIPPPPRLIFCATTAEVLCNRRNRVFFVRRENEARLAHRRSGGCDSDFGAPGACDRSPNSLSTTSAPTN
jgi:hypothetical protein